MCIIHRCALYTGKYGSSNKGQEGNIRRAGTEVKILRSSHSSKTLSLFQEWIHLHVEWQNLYNLTRHMLQSRVSAIGFWGRPTGFVPLEAPSSLSLRFLFDSGPSSVCIALNVQLNNSYCKYLWYQTVFTCGCEVICWCTSF